MQPSARSQGQRVAQQRLQVQQFPQLLSGKLASAASSGGDQNVLISAFLREKKQYLFVIPIYVADKIIDVAKCLKTLNMTTP